MVLGSCMHSTSIALSSLIIAIWTCGVQTQDPMFIVLMTNVDASASSFVLQDMYCFDRVLPARDGDCNYRVLAPINGYFSDTRIESMSIDFEHPARGTRCRIEWPEIPRNSDVTVTCDHGRNRYWELPPFRAVNSTSGWVRARNLIISESSCFNEVYTKRYYKFGLNNYPEQRPTVVFRFKTKNCVAGAVFGRPDIYRTTEAPCRYNKRRRCRPVTRRQKDNALNVVALG